MSEVRALTRAGLARAVQGAASVHRDEAAELVDSILKHMCRALSRGENVKIMNFGSFKVLQKGARPGRNPKTGQEVTIAPQKALTFNACEEFRYRISDQGGSYRGEREPIRIALDR